MYKNIKKITMLLIVGTTVLTTACKKEEPVTPATSSQAEQPAAPYQAKESDIIGTWSVPSTSPYLGGYNSNYLLYMTVKNPTENIVPLCYYIPTLGVIQNSGNHCFLMKANTEYNITINNLYEKSDDETNFNVEEPKYHLIPLSWFSFPV